MGLVIMGALVIYEGSGGCEESGDYGVAGDIKMVRYLLEGVAIMGGLIHIPCPNQKRDEVLRDFDQLT